MHFRKDSPQLIFALAAFVALGPLSTDMYLPALPVMANVLGGSVTQMQLSLSVYLAGFSIFHLVCGPLSDRFGRKPVIAAGLLLYSVSSIACAVAVSVESLLTWRFLQGVGACVGPTLARAMVRDVIPPLKLPGALATINAIMALAPIAAPILGGWMLLYWAWPSIFWFLAAYGVLAILVLQARMPETLPQRQSFSPWVVMRNYRVLVVDPRFRAAVFAASSLYAGAFAFIAASSFVLIDFMGVAVEHFGWWFVVIAVGYMLGNIFTVRIAPRYPQALLMKSGALLGLLSGVCMLGLSMAGLYHPLTIVLPVAVYTASVGVALPQAMARAMTPFPHMAGTASALLGFLQMGSAALAASVMGMFLTGEPTPLAITLIICGLLSLFWFLRLQHLELAETEAG